MGGLAAIAAQALAISIESLDGPLPADRVLAGFFRAPCWAAEIAV
ncbi:MAG: hypothetical protein R3E48_11905 [Burkholderiaceae bacterium]